MQRAWPRMGVGTLSTKNWPVVREDLTTHKIWIYIGAGMESIKEDSYGGKSHSQKGSI